MCWVCCSKLAFQAKNVNGLRPVYQKKLSKSLNFLMKFIERIASGNLFAFSQTSLTKYSTSNQKNKIIHFPSYFLGFSKHKKCVVILQQRALTGACQADESLERTSQFFSYWPKNTENHRKSYQKIISRCALLFVPPLHPKELHHFLWPPFVTTSIRGHLSSCRKRQKSTELKLNWEKTNFKITTYLSISVLWFGTTF